jgi:hypothetical protein
MKGVYMIVVTKIETIETPKNITEIERFIYDNHPQAEYLPLDGQMVNVKVLKEVIKGRRFIHPKKGYDVVLGLTSPVAEVLGLQYELYESLEVAKNYWSDQCCDQLSKNSLLKKQLDEMESWGLWKRIKCIFTGIKRPKS